LNIMAQVGINTTTPSASADLEIYSTTKGVILPVLTDAQMRAIVSPATGLIVYNSTNASYYYFNGAWAKVGTKGNILQDADADTKIQVEKTTNDNIFRIDLGNNSGGAFVNYGLANAAGYTVTGNYVIPSGKTLAIGTTPLKMPSVKGNNGSILATDGAGNWTWIEAHGGLGIASGVETMYFAEASNTTALNANTFFTPVIPFSSISVDTLEYFIHQIVGSPSIRVAIYNSVGDTIATSVANTPTVTGLNIGRIRGSGYGTLGYTGVILSAGTLYYFAITCVNSSNTTVRSNTSTVNALTVYSASKIPQPKGVTSSNSNSIWITGF
jgi:hypothetical protein